jgi:hypothetical protein
MGWDSTLGSRWSVGTGLAEGVLTEGVWIDGVWIDGVGTDGAWIDGVPIETTEMVANNPISAIFLSMRSPPVCDLANREPASPTRAGMDSPRSAFSKRWPKQNPLFFGEFRPTRTDCGEGFGTLGEAADAGRGEVRTKWDREARVSRLSLEHGGGRTPPAFPR